MWTCNIKRHDPILKNKQTNKTNKQTKQKTRPTESMAFTKVSSTVKLFHNTFHFCSKYYATIFHLNYINLSLRVTWKQILYHGVAILQRNTPRKSVEGDFFVQISGETAIYLSK